MCVFFSFQFFTKKCVHIHWNSQSMEWDEVKLAEMIFLWIRKGKISGVWLTIWKRQRQKRCVRVILKIDRIQWITELSIILNNGWNRTRAHAHNTHTHSLKINKIKWLKSSFISDARVRQFYQCQKWVPVPIYIYSYVKRVFFIQYSFSPQGIWMLNTFLLCWKRIVCFFCIELLGAH